ncbi:hypothetical protein ACET3X_003674 [Alternaria dauci]|uniref:Uncharacterized protein n=1 Tax=Alternaria dauci TaxID=48095 RepID=A0ABR3UTM1_9PLEO
MHCINTDPSAHSSGIDTSTVVGIVYGTISILIASAQLFFEYQKYRFATHGRGPYNQIAWVKCLHSVVLGFVSGVDSRVDDYIY